MPVCFSGSLLTDMLHTGFSAPSQASTTTGMADKIVRAKAQPNTSRSRTREAVSARVGALFQRDRRNPLQWGLFFLRLYSLRPATRQVRFVQCPRFSHIWPLLYRQQFPLRAWQPLPAVSMEQSLSGLSIDFGLITVASCSTRTQWSVAHRRIAGSGHTEPTMVERRVECSTLSGRTRSEV